MSMKAWQQCDKEVAIHEYLSDTYEGKKLYTYKTRWKTYIAERKQPHYDALKYWWMWEHKDMRVKELKKLGKEEHIEKRFLEELERLLAD